MSYGIVGQCVGTTHCMCACMRQIRHASEVLMESTDHLLQDTSQTSQWHVPANTIVQVGRLLKPGEDEIAQVSQEICQYRTIVMLVQ